MSTVEDQHVTSEAFAGAEEPARVPLGQLLIEAGFLNQEQLDDALYEGSRTGERVGEVVVRRGLVTEDDVARLLAAQWSLEYVERSAIWFDADALARLSREDAQRLEAMPTRIEGGNVVVAVAEPTEQRLAALREVIGAETVVIVVPKSALDAGLRSDLLRSAAQGGGQPEGEHNSEPHVELVVAPEPESLSKKRGKRGEPEEETEHLAPVTPLPVNRADIDTDIDIDTADPAASLADEAQAVADRLLAQAAAVRAQQHEMRAKSEHFEARIAELEQALEESARASEERERMLEERTHQLERIRSQLGDVLAAFGD
jgi:Type II secretion system (T2SS), protein E, N-terminal domain